MIIIKSYPGGISLHVNDTQPFDDLLEEIGIKFEESRKFFKNASVAISVEGRVLSLEEEKELIQTIDAHSDLQIICIVGKNEETNRKFVRALKRVELQKEENNCRYYKGNVIEGQCIDSEGNLVILGNVLSGATISAAKDIIVLGELCGEAYAGTNGELNHFITATRITSNKCHIASLDYKPQKSGLFDKKKNESCIIYVKDNQLVNEIITPEIILNAASI